MICANLILLLILISWILCVINCQQRSFDFGFYYNSYTQEILFYNYQDQLNAELTLDPKMNTLYPIYLNEFIKVIKEKDVFLEINLIDSYTSKAELGEFIVSNHSLLLDGLQIYLVRIDYNVSSVKYNEVILEVPSMGILSSYPQKVEQFYHFEKCTQCSKDSIKRTKKEISNTYAFQLTDDLLNEREIEKLYLIGKQNNKLTYYADLSDSYQIQSINQTITSIEFYMERLPEIFDLHITYHSSNIEDHFGGDKLLLVIKNIIYPDYEINQNPNFDMLIICIAIILTGFLLTSIALLLNIFLNKSK